MRGLLAVLMLLCVLTRAHAEDVPLIDPPDADFDKMHDFMKMETERIKAIKMLNLDLERADLELKRREIEVKLAELNKGQTSAPILPAVAEGPVLKVSGIFINGDARQALLVVDQAQITVSEGQKLHNGMVVKSISADAVMLEHADGRPESFGFGA